MKTRNKQPLSIYIHIPFCKRKCLYCDFLSAPACAQERESYVKALLREILIQSEKCREYEVISVFFGGGTPSLLSGRQMERIMRAVKKNYDLAQNAEISMECNPATASLKKLKDYRKSGINRLSIGLQSANDRELKALGRIHNYRQFLQTYEAARTAGFTNINIDLMSALPGQTLASYEDTLQKVIDLKPEHISAYSLIIEEGTPFFERYGEETSLDLTQEANEELQSTADDYMYLPLPDEDTERKMYHRTNTLLQKAGYARYEISNFARKGYECRHNLTYWTGIDYIGFGIGAASYFQGTRYKNISDIHRYEEALEQKPLETDSTVWQDGAVRLECRRSFMPEDVAWHEEIQQLSMEEKMEEFMFLGLRLKKGVSEYVFHEKFAKTIEDVYMDVLNRLIEEGVLLRKNGYVYLSKKGTDVANYVMAQFLLA